LGIGFDPSGALPIAAWSLTTALGVILFAAFLRPSRRRERDNEPGDLAAVAAAPVAPTPSAVPRTFPQPTSPTWGASADDGEATGAPTSDEAGMPRWLRPSLREQRQASDRGSLPVAHQPAVFAAKPRSGTERRTIAYRLVRLSAGPDDLRSAEVGRLDRGDEVEVIGEHDGFLHVRTPTGLEGWVPRVVIVG
jgi:hypothetical protein